METLNYIEDKKHLGTIHSPGSIDEYYHVRRKQGTNIDFRFILIRNTKTGVREFEITDKQIPYEIQKDL
jgi:hypothetical protein